METGPRTNEPGYALGAVLIVVLLGLMLAPHFVAEGVPTPGPLRRGMGTVLLGLYLQALGTMFLAAYYLSHKTFLFRGLMWVCENFSRPAGRGMAFFYFALAFGFGSVTVAAGLGLWER